MRLVALGLALALTGCQTTADSSSLVDASTMRAAIVANKAKLWKDPDSVRDTSIGEPFWCFGMWGGATCACVEANARNSFGGYNGVRRSIAVVERGQETILRGTDLTDAGIGKCNNLVPFPELAATQQQPRR